MTRSSLFFSGNRVKLAVQGDIAVVTLSRPDKHNGVDFPMLDEVIQVQKLLRRDRHLRGVILQGEGPSFCAGLDFKAVLKRPAVAAWRATQLWWPWANRFQQWSIGWRSIGVPVIALVQGNCFGAGMQLALGADVRIAHADASLSFLEAKWGLIPDMGGIALLRELLPLDKAKELVWTGRVISGQEGLACGLVTHVSDEPMALALALLKEVSARSPDSVSAGKRLLHSAWAASLWGALAAERRWQRRLIGRANQRIALAQGQGSKTKPGDTPPPKPFRARQI